MNIRQYHEIRRNVHIDNVSLGYRTVTLFPTSELEEAQIGYKIGESGEILTGENEGDWKSSWLVIASEDLLGEPLFVDLNEERLPVYTSAHGKGTWNPVMIASSFKGFIQALEEIERIAQSRQNPVQLERNPLSNTEQERTLNRIVRINGNVDFGKLSRLISAA